MLFLVEADLSAVIADTTVKKTLMEIWMAVMRLLLEWMTLTRS